MVQFVIYLCWMDQLITVYLVLKTQTKRMSHHLQVVSVISVTPVHLVISGEATRWWIPEASPQHVSHPLLPVSDVLHRLSSLHLPQVRHDSQETRPENVRGTRTKNSRTGRHRKTVGRHCFCPDSKTFIKLFCTGALSKVSFFIT